MHLPVTLIHLRSLRINDMSVLSCTSCSLSSGYRVYRELLPSSFCSDLGEKPTYQEHTILDCGGQPFKVLFQDEFTLKLFALTLEQIDIVHMDIQFGLAGSAEAARYPRGGSISLASRQYLCL